MFFFLILFPGGFFLAFRRLCGNRRRLLLEGSGGTLLGLLALGRLALLTALRRSLLGTLLRALCRLPLLTLLRALSLPMLSMLRVLGRLLRLIGMRRLSRLMLNRLCAMSLPLCLIGMRGLSRSLLMRRLNFLSGSLRLPGRSARRLLRRRLCALGRSLLPVGLGLSRFLRLSRLNGLSRPLLRCLRARLPVGCALMLRYILNRPLWLSLDRSLLRCGLIWSSLLRRCL